MAPGEPNKVPPVVPHPSSSEDEEVNEPADLMAALEEQEDNRGGGLPPRVWGLPVDQVHSLGQRVYMGWVEIIREECKGGMWEGVRGVQPFTLGAHVQAVCSLSWSRSGRRLLTASVDNTVGLWDVLSGRCERRFRFQAPVLKVQYHPRDSRRFIVCLCRMPAVLVNANEGTHVNVPHDDDASLDSGIVATFERKGRYILTGNSKGKLSVYSSEDLTLAAAFRLSSSHPIKSIEAAKKGDYFVTNSNDRILRVYDLREILLRPKAQHQEPIQKLQDLVNKTAWKTCCLSGDGEYVCGGSSKAHSLYIWEKKSGSLVKILNGTKGEILVDLQWHPARPLICSVANGIVSIWSQAHVENWSAFAPDFKELDENVEYEERESEFDLEDEDRSVDGTGGEAVGGDSAEEELDVVTVPNPSADSDSEPETPATPTKGGGARRRRGERTPTKERCEEEPLWFLPVSPEVEEPEESPTPLQVPGPLEPESGTTDSDRPASPITFHISLPNAPVDVYHPLLTGPGRKRSAAAANPPPPRISNAKPSKKPK